MVDTVTVSADELGKRKAITSGSDTSTGPAMGVVVVRPDREVMGRQALPYFLGISAASAGSSHISMNLVIIPPGGAAEPHAHRGFESAVYMVRGSVEVRFGPALEESLTLEAGEFLFMPADVPHQPVNHHEEPAVALVARNDANEQESIERFSDLA